MMGVVAGAWVVGFDWVEACLSQGCKRPEESFEIRKDERTQHRDAATKGRRSPGSLFKDLAVNVATTFTTKPSRAEVCQLVSLGGGQLVLDPKEVKGGRRYLRLEPEGGNGVGSFRWLCDCISAFEVLPLA
mmetsp:Transcript_36017/g.82317  ORF Transcript_36017/g.82317 Transcript_36017/m.82317 type:complete len:131 (-) Transcript_36017:21-413(-)